MTWSPPVFALLPVGTHLSGITDYGIRRGTDDGGEENIVSRRIIATITGVSTAIRRSSAPQPAAQNLGSPGLGNTLNHEGCYSIVPIHCVVGRQ